MNAQEYKEKVLSGLPFIMQLAGLAVKGWKPSEEQWLAAIETGYTVMKHTGDVQQAGKALRDELLALHRMAVEMEFQH